MKRGQATRVAVVTGTRAEYGLLEPVMRAVNKSKRLALQTIVAGMHLAPEFGHTADQVRRDGFRIDAQVDMLLAADRPAATAKGFGVGAVGMAQAFEQVEPDVVLVLGDRVEVLAAATAAVLSNRLLAHIHGGERTRGGHDESIRHAVTKLAHVHFPATEQSARRIIRMGEDPSTVHVVGAPGLDSILNERPAGVRELSAAVGLDVGKPFLLVVQHSVSTSPEAGGRQFQATLQATQTIGLPTVAIYPNSDPGQRGIVEAIAAAIAGDQIKAVRNLPRKQYLGLLKHAAALVGNSSSGLLEAASYKTPAVNIGIRQQGRERGANVIDADHDPMAIARALRRALSDARFRRRLGVAKNPYGDGKTSGRIVRVLERLKLDGRLLQKQIRY